MRVRRFVAVVLSVVVPAGIAGMTGISGPLVASAVATTYYFHGQAGNADDVARQTTPTATFDTIASTGSTP